MFADRIFTNAAVFQAAGTDPADTVALHDGTIVSVGRGVDRDMVGKHTEITDLGVANCHPGASLLAWSQWRRQHQYRARLSHYQRRENQ